VDILNCMGMAMLLFAPMAVFSTQERIRLCTVLGLVIAGLAPFVSMIDSSSVPWIMSTYLFPSLSSFGFFPWAAFLAFGMVAGSVIRTVKQEEMSRTMLWTMVLGIGLVFGAQYLSNLPYSVYPKSDFWLNSPGLIMIKLGVVLIILAGAFLWVNVSGAQRWSFFRQLGMTSLLVYWVHIELVYGRWFGVWKEAMTVRQVLAFTTVLLALLTALSIFKTRWKFFATFFKATPLGAARRASGD